MNATAIIYARVSTLRQAEDELPIASQLEVARKKAESLGATVLREFVDPGVSGRSSTRPEFRSAIAYCQVHKVTYFIVWNSARFSRDRADAANFKREVRRAGTKLMYVSLNIDASTDEGWMTEAFLEVMDDWHSRVVAKDTRRSMLKNAADGFFNGGRVPYGYRTAQHGKRKRLEVDEVEAPLVRKIFELYANEGLGFKEIAIRLNAGGFSKRGEPWNKKGVGLVLKNHKYIGVSIFNRRDHAERTVRDRAQWITTESHVPIIDRQIFERAQLMMEVKAPAADSSSPRSQWVFTGMARCGLCSSRMKIATATGRSKRYSYYQCGSSLKGTGCPGVRVNAEHLDELLIDVISEQLLTPQQLAHELETLRSDGGGWSKERKEARELLVRELRETEKKRDNLFQVLEELGADRPGVADVAMRLKKHRDRITQIEASLAALEQAPDADLGDLPDDADLVDVREGFKTLVQEASAEKLRLFFGIWVKEAVIGPEQAVISYYPERMITLTASDTAVHSEGRWLPERALLRTAALSVPLPRSVLRRAA